MTRSRLLMAIGIMSVLTGFLSACLPPAPAYGSLTISTSFESTESRGFSGYRKSACQGESIKMSWEIISGSNPRILVSPPQSLEPTLATTPIAKTGETSVTIRDAATITLRIDDAEDGYQQEVKLVMIPESICKGFPLELRGNYAGTLEQATPLTASVPHTLELYWDVDSSQLEASLIRTSNETTKRVTTNMVCNSLDQEDKVTCIYDPEGAAILTLEGIVTAAGYQGTYQGVLEGATFQTPTSGTFSFVKQ